ncbi:glycoside hydrolase [Marinilongibacter aquaticus]|uniref:sialidase family protein n=1 Tax=Marinilongibacter aquaticus TaxID=2975157 RepID=UPI0021BD890B|nr:sialidase family protein [Marinilongibacter aquaticus]UBM59174.1 glycoside hydrolase [Marinilongibacter aquaticus]
MTIKSIFFYSLIGFFWANQALMAQTPVYISGAEGYAVYRIPAIVSTGSQLLAFAEGRVHGSADFGDIDIVLKRSADNGKTWSALEVVCDFEDMQAGNPAPVMDFTDPKYPDGRLFLFYNTGNDHEGEIRKGKGLREVWYKTSVDFGKTWSEAENISTQVHKINQPEANPDYNNPADWRHYANTPGHALQISEGPYKGRVFVAANHSQGDPQAHFADYRAHAFYTDDHGKSFHLTENVDVQGSNESTAAELSNGRVMMNSRNQKGDVRKRIVSIGENGGQRWISSRFDAQLPDPVCEGSLLNIGERNGQKILAFCNAADSLNRDKLTLRISFDEGKTWPKAMLVDASGKDENNYTAYSDIVQVDKSNIGVLYEKNNYKTIVFRLVNWKK